MELFVGVTRKRCVAAFVIAFLLYTATFVLFPRSVLPDSALQVFYIGTMLVILLHEAVHAATALAKGVAARDVFVEFRLERAVASCDIAANVRRNDMMFITIAPLLVIGVLGIGAYSITRNYVFLAPAWVNVSFSTFDVLGFLDSLRMPRHTFFEETRDIQVPAGSARGARYPATGETNSARSLRLLHLVT